MSGACSSGGEPAPAPVEPPRSAEAPGILSAFYGLDELPIPIVRLCPRQSFREDGMPVSFSVQLSVDTVKPEMFAVQTASGETVTPRCATLRPADERLENRTVLLAGAFGTIDAQPKAVEVVGELRDVYGRSLKGLRTETITPLEAGPSLLLAERFAPDTPGLAGECPEGTAQVVQLTWEGGVTGPDGADLAEPQRLSVSVTLADGSSVTPIALAEHDPDNLVHACLDTAVKAGHFHDPRDDANPDTRVRVVPGSS